MSGNYKTSYAFYSAWNYQKEIDDLNAASEQGWQLTSGGCFHNRFVKNPNVRYRYQLDFGRIDDMPRYIETFREQGWEYINSTFNGWHYLRKLYAPSLPEEYYEIFTDKESLREMNTRWARIATVIGTVLALFALISAVRMVLRPHLPVLVQMFTFIVESALLLFGAFTMRKGETGRRWKNDSLYVGCVFAVIILGAIAGIALTEQRPHFTTEQMAESVDEPVVDARWADFEVKYADTYYLDLTMEAEKPFTFAVVDEAGNVVYTETSGDFSEENIRLKLGRGKYSFSRSTADGFHLTASIW